MDSFSIENIKSFKNNTEIELKPITIFVGKNSCGKSSLIRFPVVLAQTFDTSSASLQFYGKMIDYGTFKDVVFNHQGNDISFSTKYNIAINDSIFSYNRRTLGTDSQDIREVEIITHLGMINEHLVVTNQKLLIEGKCMFEFLREKDEKTYKVHGVYDFNNRSFDDADCVITTEKTMGFGYFCVPAASDELKKIIKDVYFPNVNFDYNDFHRQYFVEELLFAETDKEEVIKVRNSVKQAIAKSGDKNNNEKAAAKLLPVALLSIGMMSSIFGAISAKKKESKAETNSNNNEMFKQINDADYTMEEVQFWYIYNCFKFFYGLYYSVFTVVEREMSALSYIGPFRQDPERIYRDAGSLSKKVGVRGENASNVLIEDFHRNKKLIDNISSWLYKALGYKLIVTEISNGYYQLLLEDKNGIQSNISDVGYGISQILPIVTQIKVNETRKSSRDVPFMSEISIIEQPELHLHPAAQAELAELFAACVDGNPKRKLLIETHSEHFIRKLQVLIASKESKITADDVAIYYVDKDDKGIAYVDKINILPNGQFEKEWPAGFFDKAFELSMELIKYSSGS